MSGLEIDFETRSPVNLKVEGVYRYMEHPETAPLMASYTIDGGPVRRWRPPEPCPNDIVAHVEKGGTIVAHNAGFERLLWQMILSKRYGWPAVRLRQFRCTAATAAALSLPRDLDGLGVALNLSVQKDKTGKTLIDRFSKPRKVTKADLERHQGGPMPALFHEPADFPEDFERFHDYCDVDVLTEQAADRRMIPLRTECQEAYWRSEQINDRGLRIDVESAKAALLLVDRAKLRLDREMRHLTEGEVEACSQVAKLKDWCAVRLGQGPAMKAALEFFDGVLPEGRGEEIASLGKADMDDLLEREDLPPLVRKALELRRDYAKASTAKIKAFLSRAGQDGRIRGAFLFRAAGTGRYSSTGAQVHNLPRPRKVFDDAHLDPRDLFEAIRKANVEWLEMLYGEELGKPLPLLSDSIRGFIWADPGKELLAADYSGIEGAIQAWFAGEEWKVKALFDLIADPSLPDMYRRAAAGIFNTTTDLLMKKDKRRQVGKVSELSLGYQGGVGAFRSMARNYSLKLGPIFGPAWEAADPERREKVLKRYEECLERGELLTKQLTREEWMGAELVKVGWRATHPAIVASWKELEAAAREAVVSPGTKVQALKVSFLVARGFLWCLLPSGRCLAYGAPSIREVEVPWADKALTPELREKRPVVTCLGVDSQTRRLIRYALYGGLIFENVVQAIALDLLDNGIEIAERAGYPVVGHVHDEIITEVPRGWGDLAWFEKAICELPGWARGLPLTAGGWRGKRYRKD
ncbi:hypothetical protein [Methylobacterium sp. yr668]|uniref:hypothetical protein n=1 Tax=Methylobacterium sp. yr668 TaxID=1761801 RepID=UPI0008EB6096|nr:hypothetical protein [Methylobacterium sp. yr668]SFT25419.1 DNA polymerase [Methylobacterium sp. yr668]